MGEALGIGHDMSKPQALFPVNTERTWFGFVAGACAHGAVDELQRLEVGRREEVVSASLRAGQRHDIPGDVTQELDVNQVCHSKSQNLNICREIKTWPFQGYNQPNFKAIFPDLNFFLVEPENSCFSLNSPTGKKVLSFFPDFPDWWESCLCTRFHTNV